MSADDFRRAMGVYGANVVTFGDERFDLSDIYEAVKSVGREVAPRLRQLLDSTISSDVAPRLMGMLRQSQREETDDEGT